VAGGAAGGLRVHPHLTHPLRCKAIASARLENDKVDAASLAQPLRAGLLPEAWIAPPEVRQLRALLRHRAQLVRLRTSLRNRIHAVLAGHGHDRPAAGAARAGPGSPPWSCPRCPAR
jgi:transposase